MESLSDALKGRIQHFGLSKAITATQIIDAANRVIPPNFQAKVYKNNSVTVEAPNSAEAYFFKQDVDMYIERINAALNSQEVEHIKIRINHSN